jgi:hypothetical protein
MIIKVGLGGLVVTMLVSGSELCGFKPAGVGGFFRAFKNWNYNTDFKNNFK